MAKPQVHVLEDHRQRALPSLRPLIVLTRRSSFTWPGESFAIILEGVVSTPKGKWLVRIPTSQPPCDGNLVTLQFLFHLPSERILLQEHPCVSPQPFNLAPPSLSLAVLTRTILFLYCIVHRKDGKNDSTTYVQFSSVAFSEEPGDSEVSITRTRSLSESRRADQSIGPAERF